MKARAGVLSTSRLSHDEIHCSDESSVQFLDHQLVKVQHASLQCDIVGRLLKDEGIEEFRGIPYATVPGRWIHSIRLDNPGKMLSALSNG